ncbi:MAG: stage II sporulation protein R [Clostridia bacterium]|nr:stage II sporulation protein R [Clostridia bacterium]
MFYFKNYCLRFKRDKVLLSVFSIALSLYLAFSCTYFAGAAKTVRDDVVRLHILANSNSEFDQNVKLKVRDELLNKNTALLSEGVNTENAPLYFEMSKDELLKGAEAVLKENNCNYKAKITLEKEYFETRIYGDYTFPAGEYTALKVVLGEGKGKNWWCVMFPPLCIPAADSVDTNETATDCLTESGERIVSGGNKFVIKFKILEIYEELREKTLNK